MTGSTHEMDVLDQIRLGNLDVGSMSVAFEVIDKEKAEWSLSPSVNCMNRSISEAMVRRLVAIQLRGEFVANGESVIYGLLPDGREVLLDGQHRMNMVVRTGVPILSVVVRGVPTDRFSTINQGKPRSLEQLAELRGWSRSVVSVVRRLHCWLFGQVGNPSGDLVMTPEQMYRYLNRLSELPRCVEEVNGQRDIVKLFRGATAPCLGLFLIRQTSVGDDVVGRFWDKLSNGNGIGPDDPEWVLRRSLINKIDGRVRSDHNREHTARLCMLFSAFNAVAQGRPFKLARYTDGSKITNPFGIHSDFRFGAATSEEEA